MSDNNMGVLRHDHGELEPAISCYREALARNPGHIEARRNLAAALRSLSRIEEALDEFETLLTYQPGNAYAAWEIFTSASIGLAGTARVAARCRARLCRNV